MVYVFFYNHTHTHKNTHTHTFSSFTNLIITKKWIKVTISQADLNLTLNCVTVSKWVLGLIWQIYCKLPEICFFYTFCRAIEKTAKIWCFAKTSLFYEILINVLSIFKGLKWHFQDVWPDLYIIKYLDITKTFNRF